MKIHLIVLAILFTISLHGQMYYSCIEDDTFQEIASSLRKEVRDSINLSADPHWDFLIGKDWVFYEDKGNPFAITNLSPGIKSATLKIRINNVKYSDGYFSLVGHVLTDGEWSQEVYDVPISSNGKTYIQKLECWEKLYNAMRRPSTTRYSSSQPRSKNTSSSTPRRKYGSPKKYYRGPRGGCYYYSASGKKVYVDRSLCN